MKALQPLLFLLLAAISTTSFVAGDPERSPQAQVIHLVVELRSDEIQRLDKSADWWRDTEERSWSVKGPFGSGTIDSTHYFQVSYFGVHSRTRPRSVAFGLKLDSGRMPAGRV